MIDTRNRQRPVGDEILADPGMEGRIGQCDRGANCPTGQRTINRPETRSSTTRVRTPWVRLQRVDHTNEAQALGDATKSSVDEDRDHMGSSMTELDFE